MFKLSRIDRIIFYINCLFIALLIISLFSPHISPAQFWVIALFGLIFPILILLNFVFLCFWVFRRKVVLILPILTFILAWNYIDNSLAFSFQSEVEEEKGKSLKVLSYNVKNFDLYNKQEKIESKNDMMTLIGKQEADIITFQEFFTEDTDDFHNIKKLVNDLGFVDHYFEISTSRDGHRHWGIATFSKYPIINKAKLNFEGTNTNLVTSSDIKIDDEIIRVFNVHLQSFKFGNDDYEYFRKLTKEHTTDIESSKSVLKKLRDAYIRRAEQAEILSKAIKSSSYPVIVCGDFNDTPNSYTYNTIACDLRDTFLERGFGFGGTYSGPLPSFLRIDYGLIDSTFKTLEFDVIRKGNSDHFPILFELEI